MKKFATRHLLLVTCYLLLFTCCVAYAGNYPTLARCTGNNVNLRDRPNTNSRVWDQANEFQQLVVLGDTRVGGNIWYKIQQPNGGKNDTVWIFGKYVELSFTDIDDQPAGVKLLISVNENFGANSERARKVFGRPTDRKSEQITSSHRLETLSWPGLELQYLNNSLVSVSVTGRNLPNGELASFCGVWIGDPASEITDTLGDPNDRYGNQFVYRYGDQNEFTFTLTDDGSKVNRMDYQFYYDIADDEDED